LAVKKIVAVLILSPKKILLIGQINQLYGKLPEQTQKWEAYFCSFAFCKKTFTFTGLHTSTRISRPM